MPRHLAHARRVVFLGLPIIALALTGCASAPPPSVGAHSPTLYSQTWYPQTQYQAPLADSQSGNPLTIPELARRLEKADVVVVGEYHGHHGAHLLQSQLQQALHQLRPAQLLSLEPFNADHQGVVDAYLAGDIGERELIEDGAGWPNYAASYRPLMEFARHRQLPVTAANAPADMVRCVGRHGEDWLAQLSDGHRQWLPDDPFFTTAGYRDRFFRAMGGHHSDNARAQLDNSFKAQLLRDNTMAHRILAALSVHPQHQVLHITGTFHSEQREGVVASLLHRAPALEVVVITPVFVAPDDADRPWSELVRQHAGKGDYLYFLQPLPDEYRDQERHREHIRRQFRQAARTGCEPADATGSAPSHP